jgi:transcriptional regulatory protein RtcR
MDKRDVAKNLVAFSMLGKSRDGGKGSDRWEKWRPTVELCRFSDLPVKRLELLYRSDEKRLAEVVAGDVRTLSPNTDVRLWPLEYRNPWDFAQVYGAIHDLTQRYLFDTEHEDYIVHLSTGTHVAQICLFILTEYRYFPGKLIQLAHPTNRVKDGPGRYDIIDLELSIYTPVVSRFLQQEATAVSFLKDDVATLNPTFNDMINRIYRVAMSSREPILLTGDTGTGKSYMAESIYKMKKDANKLKGEFVSINCATLRGDLAMSTLFGHVRGAFTGAEKDMPGLLVKADKGVLFLDEIGELPLAGQAMLLHALEEKKFRPVRGNTEVTSDFQLIAGTNRDIPSLVSEGKFRADLLARIDLWTFRLPALRNRHEDIGPIVDRQLIKYAQRNNWKVTFNRDARERFLKFATSNEAHWSRNFRDLNSAVIRMATLASAGRITLPIVEEEIVTLLSKWHDASNVSPVSSSFIKGLLNNEELERLDPFDVIQLEGVVKVCRGARSLSEAGRILYRSSRTKKNKSNDADRLKKYLSRFGIDWRRIINATSATFDNE